MAPEKVFVNGARKNVVAGVEVSESGVPPSPQQRRQKICLICADHTSVGRPQEEGMMSVAASFPSKRNQGYRTSRKRERRLAQHNQETLLQRNSEFVKLTGLLKTKD